jgi:chlorobactene glucosyltransferase
MAFLVALFTAGALVVIALTAILNVLTFPRLRSPAQANIPVGAQPVTPLQRAVSILIPMRDEAAVIGATVESLLAQTPGDFELLVLDDGSSDGSAAVARAAGAGDPRLQVIAGAGLSPGWLGKNWACHQLAARARGETLVFTDADVEWRPGALAALLDEMARGGADVQTVWPTQITVTWGERLVVPLMALVILGYLPVLGVHHLPHPAFAAANGQCLAFRRRAYDALGGHAAVRGVIVEDIALARRAKAAGLRLRMADGAGLIACRMYANWQAVRDGYAKNIIAGYGDSPAFLLLATLFHWLVFLAPWAWLALPAFPGWPVLPAALVALGVGTRALTAAATRQRVGDALLMPVSALLMTRIAAQALLWRWRDGGARWKGRIIGQEVVENSVQTKYVKKSSRS